ncbi:putative redox protein [uncultured spirochete]|jgi:uncharacterized OsmC-like protein|uniref:Putative redox protein n=1 Tax=uncultured spirochete TaxID=156406 RepID=A0A3P3XJ22_9SPIR|nr:OsmC family protein [Rectinema subterraneum]SLM13346.1 putative redox protein [uncultured spirochete]
METSKREMKVLITGKSENPTKINLRAGKFELAIDEPKSLGGTDQGPSPVQVLLMALAGCLNVTGHEVARQKGLTLHGMKVRIEGVMNPCTFLGCSFEERAGFQKIMVNITPDFEDATDAQIEEWMKETENRCPVTDNIRADTDIEVKVAKE